MHTQDQDTSTSRAEQASVANPPFQSDVPNGATFRKFNHILRQSIETGVNVESFMPLRELGAETLKITQGVPHFETVRHFETDWHMHTSGMPHNY